MVFSFSLDGFRENGQTMTWLEKLGRWYLDSVHFSLIAWAYYGCIPRGSFSPLFMSGSAFSISSMRIWGSILLFCMSIFGWYGLDDPKAGWGRSGSHLLKPSGWLISIPVFFCFPMFVLYLCFQRFTIQTSLLGIHLPLLLPVGMWFDGQKESGNWIGLVSYWFGFGSTLFLQRLSYPPFQFLFSPVWLPGTDRFGSNLAKHYAN